MPFAYSNNGMSWRAVEESWPLEIGEVLFSDAPTPDQLASAFPGYSRAVEKASLLSQAASAFKVGLQISSTGTPGINGTYAVDALSQADIIAIETGLNAGKGFPGGATTFNYPDIAGTMHLFDEQSFTDFAAAVRDYVYALRSVASGASSVLPTAVSTIA